MKRVVVVTAAALALALAFAQPAAAATGWKDTVHRALQQGDLRTVTSIAARAAHENPADPLASAWVGVALALQGEVRLARMWLWRAAALDPRGQVGATARVWMAGAAIRYDVAQLRRLSSAAGATNRRLSETQTEWVARAILYAARAYHLDPILLGAVILVESGFNHGAVSHAGAIGFGQLMPGTARGLGVNPHHPLQNILGSARLLRGHLNAFSRWPDPLTAALAAYNAGGAAVVRHKGVPPYNETTRYVASVLSVYLRLSAKEI